MRNKLQVTQNKLIRFVLNLDSRSHVGKEQFARLNWLPVASRVDFITLCHVFKISSKTAPSYMMDHFIPVSVAHTYSTRFRVSTSTSDNDTCTFIDSCRFSYPKVKSFGKKSFAYRGCSLWNGLPQDIRNIKSLNRFKSSVKAHLLD